MTAAEEAADPRHRLIVMPWLRKPGHHFVLRNWLAITIGPCIFAWRDLSDSELAHELTHVRQWRRYGVRFIPRYVRASWRAAVANQDSYRDNIFEREANAVAARVAAADRPTAAAPGAADDHKTAR